MRGSRLLVKAGSFPPMFLFSFFGEDYFCFPYALRVLHSRCIGNEGRIEHGLQPILPTTYTYIDSHPHRVRSEFF